MKKIPIFFSFNNDYVIPAAVAFWSLLNKAAKDVFYEMHVLHSDITPENQRLLQSVVGRFNNGVLSFIDTQGFLAKEFEENGFDKSNGGSLFTSDALLKCFPARFFPQYDRIIYSDVDVVFVDDISEIYDIDLKGKYIAAVKNAFMKFQPNELSHLKPEHFEKLKDTYFAGGIWVLNLKEIRRDFVEEKMLAVVNDSSIVKRWPDQDVMNIACDNKVAYLPLNYIGYPYLTDMMKHSEWASHFTNEELYDSILNPKIIHFAGDKPWSGNPKYAEIWWTIFDYLNLPKTRIFKDFVDAKAIKIRKYKRLFNVSVVISAILLITVIGMLL